jgi:cytochrome c-type biogenesis protein CcmE
MGHGDRIQALDVLTLEEAAAYLRMPTETIVQQVHQGAKLRMVGVF